MTPLSWIKLQTALLDDPRLGMLPDGQQLRYYQLLALAGKCNAGGWLVDTSAPLSMEYIAWRLRLDETVLASDLRALAQKGLVAWDDEARAWCLPGFAESQGQTDDSQRQAWREQKRRQRLQKRQAPSSGGAPGTLPSAAGSDLFSPGLDEADDLASDEEDLSPSPRRQVPGLSAGISKRTSFCPPQTLREVVPLKNRIEKTRGEKRRGRGRGEERRGETSPSPPHLVFFHQQAVQNAGLRERNVLFRLFRIFRAFRGPKLFPHPTLGIPSRPLRETSAGNRRLQMARRAVAFENS
jgi:hypothetical protein